MGWNRIGNLRMKIQQIKFKFFHLMLQLKLHFAVALMEKTVIDPQVKPILCTLQELQIIFLKLPDLDNEQRELFSKSI